MQSAYLNGAAVKALREALGLPGSTFSVACLISHGQLSNIEAGRKPATEAVARRICAQLEAAMPPPSHPRVRIDVWAAITHPAPSQEAAA